MYAEKAPRTSIKFATVRNVDPKAKALINKEEKEKQKQK